MNWFDGLRTVESIKSRFRELAMQHHPDRGGDTRTMQDINAAYHAALKSCDGQVNHDEDNRAHTYRYNEAREQEAADKVIELLRILPAGVTLYLIGLWIWIQGTTREDRDTQAKLKTAGCVWHSKRHCWYWRAPEMRHYGRQSRYDLNTLAWRYGCRAFAAQEQSESAVATA